MSCSRIRLRECFRSIKVYSRWPINEAVVGTRRAGAVKRRGHASLLFSVWLWQQWKAGNEDALAQQMWGWLMVKGCREPLQRVIEQRWVGWCGGCAAVETPLQAFTAKQECLCSLACLVGSGNKVLLQFGTLMYNSMQKVWAKLSLLVLCRCKDIRGFLSVLTTSWNPHAPL